jgi:hypothetical protein
MKWTHVPHIRPVPDGHRRPSATRLVPAADPEVEKLPRGSQERADAHQRAWVDHFSRLIRAPGQYPPE